MNIYSDYIKYISENSDLIKLLKTNDSIAVNGLNDVLDILEYLYAKFEKEGNLDEDFEAVFETTFDFLNYILTDIKVYYNDYFNKDIISFNKFSGLIATQMYLEEYHDHVAMLDLEDELKKVNKYLRKIDTVLKNKEYNNIQSILIELADNIVFDPEFIPAYNLYIYIKEELGIN